MRRLFVVVSAVLLATSGVFVGLANASDPTVSTKTVCFAAHNLGDTISVTGTLYAKAGYTADTPVLLMLHGFGTDRTLWDGGAAGPVVGGSMARDMAARGYVVMAIDRPAYGQSQYNALLSGYKVSGLTQVDMTHEVVSQIRAGSYRQTTGSCPSGESAAFGSSRVVLVGHSFGAAISMGYVTKYHDLAGVVAWGFSNQGSNPALALQTVKNFAVPLLTLQGYGTVFAPGPNGISTECLREYHLPGTEPAVYNAMCANSALLLTPVGKPLSSTLISQTNNIGIAARTVGSTPVLLTFGEFDWDFPRSGLTGNLQQAEIDFWTNNCGCDVSSYIQPEAAHNGMLHRSRPQAVVAFDTWLRSRGVGGDGSGLARR